MLVPTALPSGQIIQEVFPGRGRARSERRTGGERRGAMKTQEMASGQAFLQTRGAGDIGLGCPEKYTTVCIEGVSGGGVRKMTEPRGRDFRPRIQRGRRHATVGTRIFHHRVDCRSAGVWRYRTGCGGSCQDTIFRFSGPLPGVTGERTDAKSLEPVVGHIPETYPASSRPRMFPREGKVPPHLPLLTFLE